MKTITCPVILLTSGPYSRLWFAQADDWSTLRIECADVLTFDVDDEVDGPGACQQFYSFASNVRGRLQIRWFLWRHRGKRLPLWQQIQCWWRTWRKRRKRPTRYRFCAVIVLPAPTKRHPRAVKTYGYLDVIAPSEAEAKTIVERHLSEQRPLGFTEAEIRKPNPKRTPWRPGLELWTFLPGHPVNDDCPIGVVLENEGKDGSEIPI